MTNTRIYYNANILTTYIYYNASILTTYYNILQYTYKLSNTCTCARTGTRRRRVLPCGGGGGAVERRRPRGMAEAEGRRDGRGGGAAPANVEEAARSEERRVGKEC